MRTLIALLLLAGPALAQQPSPAAAVQERLERTIGSLVVQNAQLQVALAAAQARVQELEARNAAPSKNDGN